VTDAPSSHAADDEVASPRTGAPTALSSAALFAGRREIVIVHRGQHYRLRITRADKLILTK
jgi:hemin uptake protein HemP